MRTRQRAKGGDVVPELPERLGGALLVQQQHHYFEVNELCAAGDLGAASGRGHARTHERAWQAAA